MNNLTARPELLKQANLSLIRRAIKRRGTATRLEITDETNISSTTVRSLLTEMLLNEELVSIGHDESSGGRKAERYRFSPDRYYSAVFCTTRDRADVLLVNIYGEIIETSQLNTSGGDFQAAIISCLDGLTVKRNIKSIGLGVPGVVEGGCYWKKGEQRGVLSKTEIGDILAQRYQVPVVMENDLNATMLGFGRCYEKKSLSPEREHSNMAYLHLEKGCISAGFIAGGKVLRGCKNFAGELGLIPLSDGKILDEHLTESTDDAQFVSLLVKILGWICGILNPQYIALEGPALRKNCMEQIRDGLAALLPEHMLAEILSAPDVWHDYHEGMAYLTAEKMFDEVQFIKE